MTNKDIHFFTSREKEMTAGEVHDEAMDQMAAVHAILKRSGYPGIPVEKFSSIPRHEESHQKPVEKYKPKTKVASFLEVNEVGKPVAIAVAIIHDNTNIPLHASIRSDIQPLLDGGRLSKTDIYNLKTDIKELLDVRRYFRK